MTKMADPQDNNFSDHYAEPLRQLLFLGKTPGSGPARWPDYSARFGFGQEHIGALTDMACDIALNQADPDSSEIWAPAHAWRALGQLRAGASVPQLLFLLNTLEEDDSVDIELPVVFGMIGPAAIPHIESFLSDPGNLMFSRGAALSGLKQIAERHPECRDECIAIVVRMLGSDADTDTVLNGFAVSTLLDLRAVEAIDAIRDAFQRNAVDISIAGDLEDVEIDLGLREQRATPKPNYLGLPSDAVSWLQPDRVPLGSSGLQKRHEVGRNDPCPCGSGKKYKKCYLQ
jgi:hypothetical protein